VQPGEVRPAVDITGYDLAIEHRTMRSVDDLAKAMGLTGISKSQISRLCQESTNVSKRSFRVLLRDCGPTCGSMRPT
jgi:hypothetical protein